MAIKCPICHGKGEVDYSCGALKCFICNGTGEVERDDIIRGVKAGDVVDYLMEKLPGERPYPPGAHLKPGVSGAPMVAEELDVRKVDECVSCGAMITLDEKSFPTDGGLKCLNCYCYLGSKQNVLREAESVVNGQRNADYGEAGDNLGATARMWQAYRDVIGDRPLDARDVCWFMVMLKAARDAHARKRDNLVDGAGYILCAERSGAE